MFRREHVTIVLALDSKQVDAHMPDIETVLDGPLKYNVLVNDIFNLRYDFQIEYFGRIAEKLKALTNVIKDGGKECIKHAELKVLASDGKSVIHELSVALDNLIKELA